MQRGRKQPGRGRQWRSLLIILFLIGALSGGDLAIHAARVRDTAEGDKRPALVHLGLDLQGGISVVLSPVEGSGEVDGDALDKARDIIAQRVDGLGVAEPEISVEGSNIAVQLPGLTKAQDALALIGTTAKLSFRPVLAALPPTSVETEEEEPEGLPDCADPSTFPDDVPDQQVVFCARTSGAVGELDPQEWERYLLGPVALAGDDVSGANASLGDPGVAAWTVELNLTREGSRKFAAITGELACPERHAPPTNQLAIVLDGIIESHPQMGDDVQCDQGISGGTASITGSFTEGEARDLALVLKFGALPVELEPATTTTISPTLGRDSLRGGLVAGAIGIAVVFLYVLAFYRGLGLVIWVGLLLHGALTLAVVVFLGQTVGFALTLAGVAGLIVSLGIATDSFIVYLERITEEVRSGRTTRTAVDRAWAASWRTILAADFVTALGAAVLYLIAVGSVRGFALMLGIATLLDIVISRMYMHPAVWLLAQTKVIQRSRTMGIPSIAGAEPVAGGAGS
jgi:protein-export membrane protein SecD